MLLCVLEAVEGRFCLLEALEVPEMTRCVLLCMLEAVEGGIYLLEVLEVSEVVEAMHRVLLSVCWRRWR